MNIKIRGMFYDVTTILLDIVRQSIPAYSMSLFVMLCKSGIMHLLLNSKGARTMSNQCKDLDKLSTDRKWDDVFHCLKIDVNSTIELGNLKVSQIGEQSDKWLDDYKATMNSLEVILAIILLFDQIFYILLVWYLICFAIKFIRYRGLRTLCQLTKRFYSLEKKIKNQNKSEPLMTRKKTITFTKGAFDNSKY